MIQLKRVRGNGIPASLRGAKRVEREHELLEARRDFLRSTVATPNMKWKSSYWKAGKEQMKAESAGKCAYCEAPTDVVAHGDVEHYRPKSKYWWLTYCYDNHIFSCQICNQTYKGDNFTCSGVKWKGPTVAAKTTDARLSKLAGRLAPDPLDDAAGMSMKSFLKATTGEKAALPDPYVVDPEPLLRWEVDEVEKEVRLVRRDNSALSRAVFTAVDEHLGLNRQELRRWRWELACKHLLEKRELLAALATGDTAQIKSARSILKQSLRDMMASSKPFAGMVRYFIREAWQLDVD